MAQEITERGLQQWLAQLVRFAVVGGSNTAITLLLFVLLQRWVPAPVAYTMVFLLGLAYTTALTARVVFGATPGLPAAAAFVGWYLSVYVVGLGVVATLDAVWDPSSLVTAVSTVAVTAPLTFIGGHWLFARSPRPPSTDSRRTPAHNPETSAG